MKDPKQFRERFKKWKEGTPIEEIYDNGRPTEYIEYMKRLAQPMAKNWEISEKEAYVHLLNDDSYDYYGWWKDGGKNIDPKTMEAAKPPLLPNDDGHFPDTYKTAKHPTFSNQSKYSGVVHPKYNPLGIHGGAWLGDTYLKGPMYLPGYSGGKDDRTYIGGSNLELVVTPGKSWVNPYTGEYTRATESYAQPIASNDPYVDYQFYSPTGNSIVQTINSTPRWQQYWADQEGARVAEAKKKAAPYILNLLTAVDAIATGPEMLEGLYGLYNLAKKRIYAPYRISKALNKAVKNNSVFETTSLSNAKVRTKLGDVEINNPQLAYRQIDKKAVDDFLNSGQVRTPEGDYAKSTTVTTKRGITFDFGGKTFDNPMFALGRLWYGVPTKEDAGLLVTSEPLGVATKGSSLVRDLRNGTFDLRYPDVGKAGRRVLLEEGQLNPSNTSAYIFDPNYGYRKVISNPSTMGWPDAVRTTKIPETSVYGDINPLVNYRDNAAVNWFKKIQAEKKIRGYPTNNLVDMFEPTGYSKDVTKGLSLETTKNLMYNSVERNIELFRREGVPESIIDAYREKAKLLFKDVNVGKYSSRDYANAGWGNYGGFYTPERNFISMNKDFDRFALESIEAHEGRHLLDFNTDLTDAQLLILREAYGDDFVNLPKLELYKEVFNHNSSLSREEITTNLDARNMLIPENLKYANRKTQDYIIDKLATDEMIFNAVENANGYGRRYIEYLRQLGKLTPEKARAFRNAMLKVGGLTGLLYSADKLLENPSSYTRGKDSGIYIKPSKRGTFTAAAKKRGMSVLSFASKVLNNPSNYSKAMRKKALFAKNASKFKH